MKRLSCLGSAQNIQLITLTKEISSYIQQENVTGIFQESVTTKYMTSQLFYTQNSPFLSNYFTTSVRMELNPYAVASNVAANLPQSTNYTISHRIVEGYFSPDAIAGFNDNTLIYDNRTSQNGLYIQMMNGTPLI